MQFFSPFDYSIIAFYFAGLIGLAFYLKRRAGASLEDYFLGARKMPWYMLGVSGMAWSLDMTGTMLIVSFLYLIGPRGLFIEFRGGANLVLIFMMLWAGKWHRRSGCMTGAEWNIFRFGQSAGGQATRLITAFVTIAGVIGMLAYMIKGDGLFLATFLPFRPFTCAIVLVVVATLYTVVSGFYGVVYTDIFQCGFIVLAVTVITILAVQQINGYDGDLAALAQEVTGNPAWISSTPRWHTPMPPDYKEFEPLLLVTMFYLLRSIMAGMGGGADPRYFGARSERDCGLLTFLWSNLMIFRWPFMMGFAVLGLFLMHEMFPDKAALTQAAELIRQSLGDISRHRWHDQVADIIHSPQNYPALVGQLQALLQDDWTTKLKMVNFDGTINAERIVPTVLFYRVPLGVRGLVFVALIAASMSTFNSFVNMATGFFTKDIYQAFIRPEAGNRELIGASYAFGVFMVACGVLLGYTTTSINHIWDWIIMGLGAGVALPTILRLYWWRFNSGGVVIGTIVGLLAAIIQHAFWPDMGPWQKFSLLTGIGLVGTLAGTWLTRPTDMRVLANFYVKTRPFGLWGPLKHLLSEEQRRQTAREHFYDLISVPFALTYQVTLFLLPMQLMIRQYRAFGITFVIFAFCGLMLYKLWYKNLPASAHDSAAPDRPSPGAPNAADVPAAGTPSSSGSEFASAGPDRPR